MPLSYHYYIALEALYSEIIQEKKNYKELKGRNKPLIFW